MGESIKVSTGAALPSAATPRSALPENKKVQVLQTGEANEGVSEKERQLVTTDKLDSGPNLGKRGEYGKARYVVEYHGGSIIRSDN